MPWDLQWADSKVVHDVPHGVHTLLWDPSPALECKGTLTNLSPTECGKVTGGVDCTNAITLLTNVTLALLGHSLLCSLCEMACGEDLMARPRGWSPANCQQES